MSIKVTVVFDIGKTNKKILLFDEEMNVVHVEQQAFKEVKDDEGFFTENIDALESWIDEGISWVVGDSRYDLELPSRRRRARAGAGRMDGVLRRAGRRVD